jgi:hypothetical protein
MARKLFTSTLLALSIMYGACNASLTDSDDANGTSEETIAAAALTEESQGSERKGIGIAGLTGTSNDPAIAAPSGAATAAARKATAAIAATAAEAPLVSVDARKSLFITEEAIVNAFSLAEVLDRFVAQSGVAGLTRLDLFHQWWDTENKGPGLGLGAHCDDQGGFNEFPLVCPRPEGQEAASDPFSDPTAARAYFPLALVNRFDLAPTSGAHCGEYRMVFARRSGISDGRQRNFIIFEAVLPNPRPEIGLEGCRPVQTFWQDLAQADRTPAERASALHGFYIDGLTGFRPVVHIENYGAATRRVTGQIRTNQFLQPNWNLREFKLSRTCSAGTCTALRFVPVTVKTNPPALLFASTSSHAKKGAFDAFFPSVVSTLASGNVNTFSMGVPNELNAFESEAQGLVTDYGAAFGTDQNALRTAIQTELSALGSALTPDHIVARAQALSCAGCHELSNGADLGGGMTFPRSLNFTHVREVKENGPEGPRFVISPALSQTFLPHRRALLEEFLNTPFTLKVNFQPAGTPVPAGYRADVGAVLGTRAPGVAFGWNSDHGRPATDRNVHADQRFDTFIAMASGSRWEAAVPNGQIDVHIVAGDPTSFNAVYKIAAEGTLVIDGTPTSASPFIEGSATVTVTDGRLTLTTGSGAMNNRICFVEISRP